jgi:hypothetical protein
VDRESYTNKNKKRHFPQPNDDSGGSIDLIEDIKLNLIDPEANFVVSNTWFNKVPFLKLRFNRETAGAAESCASKVRGFHSVLQFSNVDKTGFYF